MNDTLNINNMNLKHDVNISLNLKEMFIGLCILFAIPSAMWLFTLISHLIFKKCFNIILEPTVNECIVILDNYLYNELHPDLKDYEKDLNETFWFSNKNEIKDDKSNKIDHEKERIISEKNYYLYNNFSAPAFTQHGHKQYDHMNNLHFSHHNVRNSINETINKGEQTERTSSSPPLNVKVSKKTGDTKISFRASKILDIPDDPMQRIKNRKELHLNYCYTGHENRYTMNYNMKYFRNNVVLLMISTMKLLLALIMVTLALFAMNTDPISILTLSGVAWVALWFQGGLSDLFKNYLYYFIILFNDKIHPGNIISLEGFSNEFGCVVEICPLYTVLIVKRYVQKDYINTEEFMFIDVPNSNFYLYKTVIVSKWKKIHKNDVSINDIDYVINGERNNGRNSNDDKNAYERTKKIPIKNTK